jgi:hypothetical protein
MGGWVRTIDHEGMAQGLCSGMMKHFEDFDEGDLAAADAHGALAQDVGSGALTAALNDAWRARGSHVAAGGGVPAVPGQARFVEVEGETPEALDEALAPGARMSLLDNPGLDGLREVVRRNAGAAGVETSGGLPLHHVRTLAETGGDRISVASLAKDAKAIDFAMRFEAL